MHPEVRNLEVAIDRHPQALAVLRAYENLVLERCLLAELMGPEAGDRQPPRSLDAMFMSCRARAEMEGNVTDEGMPNALNVVTKLT
jgi:hypothetical protein